MVARPRCWICCQTGRRKSDGGGDASARLAFAVQPFAEPAGLTGVKAGLLRECAGEQALRDPALLGVRIKALPVPLQRARPIDEAISTAGA